MTLSNELRTLRGEADLESIERRLSDLESKVEDIEAVLSSLCIPQKKSRSWSEHLKDFYLGRPKTKPKVSEDERQEQTAGAK
jgi:septation ring formation regulator EzrA